MAKYKVRCIPKQSLILNRKFYTADLECEIIMTEKEVVVYKPFITVISHELLKEEENPTQDNKTPSKRGRPPKKESE